MRNSNISRLADSTALKLGFISLREKRATKGLPLLALPVLIGALIVLLSGCGTWTNDIPGAATQTNTQANVNGFGTAANHPHAMLVFPNNVIVLATHYGTFWSGDAGQSWKQVAGGSGQAMDGLMSFSLSKSTFDSKRLYVLTQVALSNPKGTLGLYTSDDQGQSWQLATAASDLTPNKSIYLTEAGNDAPGQVYVYLPALGVSGLKVSMDYGKHFGDTGTFPFGDMTSLLAVPGAKGHLVAGSSSGLALSDDSGKHWQTVKGIEGGIFNIISAGPNQSIYADGDNGLYTSQDGGKTFILANQQATYGISLTVSPTQPQVLYGHTAQSIYRSTNGGKTWNTLPTVKGQLYNLAADPQNPQQVYLSMSYPTEVYHFNQASRTWSSLTPKS